MADIPRNTADVESILTEDRFLRSLAWSLLGNGDDVEDAVQDTWLRGLDHPLREPAALRSFLSRILRNRIRNLRRAEGRRTRHEKSAARPEALPSTEEMVAAEELRRRVGEAVLALDEPYRTTIWLRFREELPPRDVANRMGVPVSTVRTRVRRALEQMRSRLDADYGDRGAWSALLAAGIGFGEQALAGTATLTIMGAITMKKILVGLGAVLVLLAGLAGVWILGGEDARPGERAQPDTMVSIAAEHPGDPDRTAVVAVPAPDQLTPLRGTLLHADGRPAAAVPFWTWEGIRPPWTRAPDEPRFVYGDFPLDEPAGETDAEGHWQVSADELEAMTFAPFESILVSYELERDPKTAEQTPSWTLPPFALSQFQILGLRPDEHWMAQIWPSVEFMVNQPVTDAEIAPRVLLPYEARGEIAAVSVLAVTGETAKRQTGIPEVSFPTLVGLVYQRDISGIGFELEQPMGYFIAPGAESLSIARRGPILRVRVMEPGGALADDVNGRAIYWQSENNPGFGRWDQAVERGRADIGWGLFQTGMQHELRVVMDDGEQFAAEFRFASGDMEKVLTFEQGQGLLPSLTVELPGDANLEDCSVVLEDSLGQFTSAAHFRRQAFDSEAIGRPIDATFTERGSHTLLLTDLPEGWVQLWIVTTEGRVVHLRNPGAMTSVRTQWLPDTELEELDLQGVFADGGLRSCVFQLELRAASGRSLMQPADSFRSSKDTYQWPVWHKRAPIGMQYRVQGFGAGSRAEFELKRK